MADWFVKFLDRRDGVPVGEFSLQNPEVEVRNSEVGGFSGEIGLGQYYRGTTVGISRDQFVPYECNYEVWRQSTGSGVCISDGMLTSLNLNFNRDTVLVAGKDWKHYLQRRIYPFKPEDYVTYNANASENYWDKWPKRWPSMLGTDINPVDIALIVRDLLQSMRTGKAVDAQLHYTNKVPTTWAAGVPDITWNIGNTGTVIPSYVIYPGDQTTIYDHIQKLSEMKDGFEWDITPISHEFKLWSPKRYAENWATYWFAPSESEAGGAISEFDWTNEGPNGTYLIGLGAGEHKMGATWTTVKNVDAYGRLDLVYDYGEVKSYDMILNKLKDQNDLWAQKKLGLTLLNPEFLPTNFYTGGRPRSLIGDTVRVTHFFRPLHEVNAYFQINAIKWAVDASSNEHVTLELMQIYEPATGSSGGIPARSQ